MKAIIFSALEDETSDKQCKDDTKEVENYKNIWKFALLITVSIPQKLIVPYNQL